jgi:hypothetical protein
VSVYIHPLLHLFGGKWLMADDSFGADRTENFGVVEVDDSDRNKETSGLYDIEVCLRDFYMRHSERRVHRPFTHRVIYMDR